MLRRETRTSARRGQLRDRLTGPDVYVVDICTPNDSHLEDGIGALQAGFNVMCDTREAFFALGGRDLLRSFASCRGR